MLDMDISRTTCKKLGHHASLDNCSFQTNHSLQWVSELSPPGCEPPPQFPTPSNNLHCLEKYPQHFPDHQVPDTPTPTALGKQEQPPGLPANHPSWLPETHFQG